MLALMRKHAGNWMIKVLLGAIALAFALSWGVYSYYQPPVHIAMKVNGEPVTTDEVDKLYEQLLEQARKELGPGMEKLLPMLKLRQRAMAQIADRLLLKQAARRIGLMATDREVAVRVVNMPAFQRGGRFDMRLYRMVLARNHLTPEEFEASVREQVLTAKMAAVITAAALVPKGELNYIAAERLRRIKAAWVVFKYADFAPKVKLSEADLKDYYRKNIRRYMAPERISIRYVLLRTEDFKDKAEVTPEDIRDYYEMNLPKYHRPEQVHLLNILIKLPKDPTPAEVAAAKKKAEKLLALARQGKDFATLARTYSQGPTAAAGGDVGWVKRGQLVKELERLVFSLKPGQVGMVRTPLGFHVVKVVARREPETIPLEKVREEIRAKLVAQAARELAEAQAERMFEAMAGGKSLQELAKAQGLKLHTSPLIARGQLPPELKGLKGLWEGAQDLSPGQPLPPMTCDAGAVVAVLARRVEPAPRPFKEVRELVRAELVHERARALALAAARKALEELAKARDPLKALEAMEGAATSGWLAHGQEIKDLAGSRRLVRRLWLRPKSRPLVPEPVEVGGGFALGALAGTKEPSRQAVAKEARAIRPLVLAARRRGVLERFIAALRAKAEVLVPVQEQAKPLIPGCGGGMEIVWVRKDITRGW